MPAVLPVQLVRSLAETQRAGTGYGDWPHLGLSNLGQFGHWKPKTSTNIRPRPANPARAAPAERRQPDKPPGRSCPLKLLAGFVASLNQCGHLAGDLCQPGSCIKPLSRRHLTLQGP